MLIACVLTLFVPSTPVAAAQLQEVAAEEGMLPTATSARKPDRFRVMGDL